MEKEKIMKLHIAHGGINRVKTIADALDRVRSLQPEAAVITIAPGTYREKVVIDVPGVTIRGEGGGETRIVWDDSATMLDDKGEPFGTFRTATLRVSAADVTLENLTIVNNAGPGELVGQAVAAYIAGDRCHLRGCRLQAHQDTLLLGPDAYNPAEARDEGCHVCLEDCYIEGTVDFIFGSYRAWFGGCHIHCLQHPQAIIAAPNTPEGQPFGFVFADCTVTGDGAPGSVYLGRPWRPYGQAAYLRSALSEQVNPAGWLDWADPPRAVHAGLCEYACTGAGSALDARHPGAGKLTEEQAARYTKEAVLEGWEP